jgi:diacylglycerol kinase family enzyme
MSAAAMGDTTPKLKKIFGKSSYLVTLFMNFFNTKPVAYELEIDGRNETILASDLMVANCGILGYRTLRWWPEVQPDDGQMDLCYVKASTGLYYSWVVTNFLAKRYWRNNKLNHIPMKRSMLIKGPVGMAVQGDGDVVTKTPVEIVLEPAALKIAVHNKT